MCAVVLRRWWPAAFRYVLVAAVVGVWTWGTHAAGGDPIAGCLHIWYVVYGNFVHASVKGYLQTEALRARAVLESGFMGAAVFAFQWAMELSFSMLTVAVPVVVAGKALTGAVVVEALSGAAREVRAKMTGVMKGADGAAKGADATLRGLLV